MTGPAGKRVSSDESPSGSHLRTPVRIHPPRADRARRMLAIAVTVVGALLVVASYAGAVAGLRVLPFDSHHIFGQFGGVLLVLLGMRLLNTAKR